MSFITHALSGIWHMNWPSQPRLSLSQRFKAETKEVHTQVERHLFVQELLGDRLTEKAYQQYLVDLHLVYNVLEKQLKLHCDSSFIQPIYFENLFRFAALNQDLNESPYFKEECHPSSSAQEYANYLEYLGQYYPLGLISHNYVRYLGDLSGGMILKSHVKKKWPEAVFFYDFTNLLQDQFKGMKPFQFKEYYKEQLDKLPIAESEYERLIKEVEEGYTFAEKMFNEIPLNR